MFCLQKLLFSRLVDWSHGHPRQCPHDKVACMSALADIGWLDVLVTAVQSGRLPEKVTLSFSFSSPAWNRTNRMMM